MDITDENGWSDIHFCAAKGYTKSIERFVENELDLIELETTDYLRQTPFLLAVSNDQQEAVTCLIHLGAKVNAVNSLGHGAVEICALKEYSDLLRYFISLDLPVLPVWANLLKMLVSDSEEEVEAAGKCLRSLTDRSGDRLNPGWRLFYENGGVSAVIKVARSSVQDYAKIPAFETILNVIERSEIQEQLVSSGGVQTFIQLLKSSDNNIIKLSAQITRELSKKPEFAETLVQNQAVSHLLKILQTIHDSDVLVPVVQSLGHIAHASDKLQTSVGTANGLVASLVSLFDSNNHLDLMLALMRAVSKIVDRNKTIQSAFVSEGITQIIVNIVLKNMRSKEIQTTAVETIHKLAQDNKQTQNDLIDKGAERLLLQMLRRNRAEDLQEKIAMALWVLAGDGSEAKREMANDIGVQTLVEFASSKSENLHFIGSEGLGVLAQGAVNQQTEIADANGVPPLVLLMKSQHEYIVLSVIKTLRHLCVGVGCVPHLQNQNNVFQCQGIRFLVALMVHSTNEVIQVEAAHTLGSLSLGGSKEILNELYQNADFSYVRILKMLYSRLPFVRLTAGSALSYFAYNNLHQQKGIAEQGGVRFNCFVPFLQSEDEFYRSSSAYQVVVLARIITDESQARSSAAGIKLLVDLLQDSTSEEILALTADYIARLSHNRAGVPAALVAVNAVDYLCTLLLSNADQVRGNAAVALAYLSHDHKGERLILRRCRNDPYLMKVIRFYTKHLNLASSFTEGWQHYRKVGLPPVPQGRPNLVQKRSHKDSIRPTMLLNLEDNGSQIQSSNSAINEYGDATTRSHSRSYRVTSGRDSSQNSLVSLPSQRSLSSMNSLVCTGNEM